jgi:hypothetical protein
MPETASDKTDVVAAHRDMVRAMLERDTVRLDALLDDQCSLQHITGYRQSKSEWLAAIRSGEMRYHSAREQSVSVEVQVDTAMLVARSVVDATIYGGRGTWNLELSATYERQDGTWIAMQIVAQTF